MNKKLIIVVFLLFFLEQSFFAQSTEALPEVMVIARAQEDKILLRWTLNTPSSWRKGNKYGYILERYTISRDRKTLIRPEKLIINQNFMPAPMIEWEAIMETSDMGAIMAQALWGEDFEVEGGEGLTAIINKAGQQQQRFAFGLYAADQDFIIAQKAGLGYIDTTVKSNEKYLYKVYSNIPETELATKEGGVYIGLMDYEPLPEPVDFVGVFQDGATLLSWDSKLLKDTYNSYILERSADGQSFTPLSDVPYTDIQQTGQKEQSRTLFIDSIQNNKSYLYRIKGVTSFGEKGPYSNVVTGSGKSVLKYVPHLTTKKLVSDTEVALGWEFPKEGMDKIKSFTLKRADRDKGPYKPVVEGILPTARSIRYNKLRRNNYFKITAIGKQNNQRDSFAMLVQPIDSIPPERPVGLEGKVDSTGVVQLQWTPNTEEDILGYQIYRGNLKKEEYSQLTKTPFVQHTFVDTVKVESLNSKVYYQVVAVDQRYNRSEFSEVLELTKPDIIPPTSPVFTSYEIIDGTVYLEWANSSSEDVAAHYVYRKTKGDTNWNLIVQSPKFKNTTYKDKQVEEGKFYSYTILAMDQSGLESQPSPPISLQIPKTKAQSSIKGFYGTINTYEKRIELSWRNKIPNLQAFQLYRKVNDNPMELYREIPATANRFLDQTLTINTKYTYLLRAVFKDGSYSNYSKQIINY